MNIETAKPHSVRTIGVGGQAGDGVREAGVHFGEFAQRIGCHAFLAFYYPSLIRGGHNFGRVSFSPEAVHADHALLDILVALNADSVRIRHTELAPNAITIVETTHAEDAKQYVPNLLALPMFAFTKELNAPRAAASSSAIGAVGYISGLEREEFAVLCQGIFSDLVGGKELNTSLALKGYDHACANEFPKRADLRSLVCVGCVGELIEGNKAVAKGMQSAGLKFYVGYPMTPSTSILHFLAKEAAQGKLKVVHPEDEIAVINMALGVAYTGTRVAVGTANGGFALMQEAFSFAGVSELPITIVVSQRQGPATGVATHTGQSDLRFVLHAGHGEFPRFVIAPGDVEECYEAGALALNLSWKYQVPSIILLDKHISESQGTACIDMTSATVGEESRWDPAQQSEYNRFAITDSGVSPFAAPGTPHANVKATSYEHDEFGVSVDDAEEVLAMQDKRWRKLEGLKSEFANYQPVKVFGNFASDVAVVFWGSTKGAVLEAAKYLKWQPRFVQILWIEPFDITQLMKVLNGVNRVIVIEGNHGAQMAGLLRERTGYTATETITRYDSEPFEPMELAEELNRRLG